MTSPDQFEAWFAELGWKHSTCRAAALEAWEASRAAVVVDLTDLSRCFSPNDCADWAMWLSDVKETVEAAGLKVAP